MTTHRVEAPVLRIAGLTARYADEDILRGVSVDVPRGSIVALLGPNGSGKSTLLKAIYGLVAKRAGTIEFCRGDGRLVDLMRLRPYEITAHGVDMVPQIANTFPDLSVRENLEIGAIRNRARITERIGLVLEVLPLLRPLLRRRAATLSGGQRQTLGIARALMSDPELLILDEPSAGLAPSVVDDVFTQVRAINRAGVSILIVEQKARQCLAIADYGYVLDQGRNQIDGPSARLLADPEMVRLYLGARRRGPESP